VRPGCLSMSLIHGRNELPWRRRNELDVEYVRKYSLSLDLRIFFQGIWTMLVTRRGVYSPGEFGTAPVIQELDKDGTSSVRYETTIKE